jgi:hypothetical protein
MARAKTVVCATALLWLGGCTLVPPAVVPADAWRFDPTRRAGTTVLPEPDATALTQRVAGLRLQRAEIRARIAGEADARQRQRLYEQLHAVGMQLSPLERRLSAQTAAR